MVVHWLMPVSWISTQLFIWKYEFIDFSLQSCKQTGALCYFHEMFWKPCGCLPYQIYPIWFYLQGQWRTLVILFRILPSISCLLARTCLLHLISHCLNGVGLLCFWKTPWCLSASSCISKQPYNTREISS